MFNSLRIPRLPKNACQIHISSSRIASSTKDVFFSFPLYCPAQAREQFFQSLCWQSIEPMHPRKLRAALIFIIRTRSSSVGSREYSSPKQPITSSQISLVESKTDSSDNFRYSSSASAEIPSNSVQSAAVMCCKGWIYFLFTPSTRHTNKLIPRSLLQMRSNTALGKRKRFWNSLSVFFGVTDK